MFDEKTLKAIGAVIGKQANKLVVESDAKANDVIDLAPLVKPWKPGKYSVGDVRVYNGAPYKCIQEHDSEINSGWNPVVAPSLWANYHGTDADHALPWVQPTGAHDMYKAGEYMIYIDGSTYRCISDTAYSPVDYAQAWEVL